MSIDFCPSRDIAQAILDHGKRKTTRNALARLLPSRLSAMLCELHGWTGQAGALPAKTLTAMERLLHAYPFHPSGLESLNKAEVTTGGVDTDQISSKTMETKARRGLFFTGEVLDVTGRLGGYNLQWAWSSGFVAGQWA